MEKDAKLSEMSARLQNMEKSNSKKSLNLKSIIQDLKIDHPECNDIFVNQQYTVVEGAIDTSYSMLLRVSKKMSRSKRADLQSKIEQKLLLKLKDRFNIKQDSVQVYIF